LITKEKAHDSEGEQDGDVAGVSTAASGPAGAHFEQQVAAFYLLAMLCGAPPRGMPGARIERIRLQQANDGHPLDDVILSLTDTAGHAASLEIQVKRTIPFSPQDKIFAKVVEQIADTAKQERFMATTVEMAVAASRGSRNIDGAYQDVLAIARQVPSGQTFASHIGMPGVGNPAMRQFVSTFKANLASDGAPCDDDEAWRLLRRLQILIFDFEAPGSASRDLARERCRGALAPEHVGQADALWAALVEIAFETAKRGGSHDRLSLLDALKPLGLKLAGERRHSEARRAIAESVRETLADIKVQVGSVQLARSQWVDQVRTALGQGRYVEIRGEPGVGKSGVLRLVAELMQREGQVIVLDPSRCIPKGGAVYCAHFGFQGSARELLSEFAADGGAILFVDNLDFYGEGERATVTDLLRAAASISAVSVVTTARPGFGVDDADWLPAEALTTLNRATPIWINELSEGELAELSVRAPELAPLLAPNHPASRVSNNLFRLNRLALRAATAQSLRTEIDLAEQWWMLADGLRDEGLRDRLRLLKAMGVHALGRPDLFECDAHPPLAIDALRSSGSLRELRPDRVDFQHDVLREWAIAFTLDSDPSHIDALPLKKPATAALARGIELAARLSLERATDDAKWRVLLERVSRPGTHRSWRRFVLLAVTRSEAVDSLLPRATQALLADGGTLLKELSGSVTTVEVTTLGEALKGHVLDVGKLPSTFSIPKGAGWSSLIEWLLKLGTALPANAVPSVVRLFHVYAFGTFARGPLVVQITEQIGKWLRDFEPEGPLEGKVLTAAFDWKDLDDGLWRPLGQDLHDFFLLLAQKVPEQAQAYLRAVIDDFGNNAQLAGELVLRPYNLVLAAPKEIAELSLRTLATGRKRRRRTSREPHDEAFSYLDNQFLPVSPAQGPFFALLNRDSGVGLDLVRRLVAHAVEWSTRGSPSEADGVVLHLEDGPRTFPWTGTYVWSRQSDFYAMTSALQALEAWAHRRLDANEAVEVVLADVLGPPGTCAAFVLIAVDLVISHWPVTIQHALPFLSNPELLGLEIERAAIDQLAHVDPFGLEKMFGLEHKREPAGAVSYEELRKRASRRHNLLSRIPLFMAEAPPERSQQLIEALQTAAQLLGPYGPHHTLRDPAFMVRHALHQADLANWQDVQVQLKDGRWVDARSYKSPSEEDAHLKALRTETEEANDDMRMTLDLSQALKNRTPPSGLEIIAAIKWAQAPQRDPSAVERAGSAGDAGMRKEQRNAVLTAALLVMRDGEPALREVHAEWAIACFDAALKDPSPDHVLQIRDGLAYNPLAISFAGRLHALGWRKMPDDLSAVLLPAARGVHEAVHGLGEAIEAVMAADGRLVKSLIRCALHTCIRPHGHWNATPEEKAATKDEEDRLAAQAVSAELQWLAGNGLEPSWPQLPRREPRLRARLRVPRIPVGLASTVRMPEAVVVAKEADDETSAAQIDDAEVQDPRRFNHQTAALWLRQLGNGNLSQFDWLPEFVCTFMPWTMTANGADLPEGEGADDAPCEWNEIFFQLALQVLPENDVTAALVLVESICTLNDQNFFDLTDIVVRTLDEAYFGSARRPSTPVAVGIRSALADHLVKTRGWRRAQRQENGFTEYHFGYAVERMFFNGRSGLTPSSCYLTPLGIDRLGDFIPVLEKLVAAGPCRKVAQVLLNLLEVSPRPKHLPLLALAGRSWWESFDNSQIFWVEAGVGNRFCRLVQSVLAVHGSVIEVTLGMELAHLAADLVALGVSEAPRLEAALSRVLS
jgi:hypothetical protein